MNKFCKLMQKTVEFSESEGEVHCLSQGQEPGCNCAEAMLPFSMAGTPQKICKYSITGKGIAALRKGIVLTDYTLIEEADAKAGKPAARPDKSVSETGVCDICSQKVSRPNGYLLTTSEVVGTAAYWQHYYQHHKSKLAGMGVSSFQEFCRNPLIRTSCGEALARQSTPWMVCDRCIQMFTVNRDQARSYARQWWDSGRKYSPPGTGPAPLSAVNMVDDRAMFSSGDVGTQSTQAQSQRGKKWWEFWK